MTNFSIRQLPNIIQIEYTGKNYINIDDMSGYISFYDDHWKIDLSLLIFNASILPNNLLEAKLSFPFGSVENIPLQYSKTLNYPKRNFRNDGAIFDSYHQYDLSFNMLTSNIDMNNINRYYMNCQIQLQLNESIANSTLINDNNFESFSNDIRDSMISFVFQPSFIHEYNENELLSQSCKQIYIAHKDMNGINNSYNLVNDIEVNNDNNILELSEYYIPSININSTIEYQISNAELLINISYENGNTKSITFTDISNNKPNQMSNSFNLQFNKKTNFDFNNMVPYIDDAHGISGLYIPFQCNIELVWKIACNNPIFGTTLIYQKQNIKFLNNSQLENGIMINTNKVSDAEIENIGGSN